MKSAQGYKLLDMGKDTSEVEKKLEGLFGGNLWRET
jgi:hypothetical protein